MQITQATDGAILWLGRNGENDARAITFDVSEWVQTYGAGTVQAVAKRQNDYYNYPVALTRQDDVVTWTITSADVAQPGAGQMELRYYVGDVLAKSAIWRTKVDKALFGPVTDPTQPEEAWGDQIIQAGVDAQNAADAAAQSAEEAAESAQTAAEEAAKAVALEVKENADRAEQAAQDAQAAQEAIEDMTVSSETLAPGSAATVAKTTVGGVVNLAFGIPEGEKGDMGETGPQGEQGVGIASVTYNQDYTITITLTNGTSTTTGSLRGATGATGTSAYQAAVAAGYTGTEAEFNSDLANFQTLATQAQAAAADAGDAADRAEAVLNSIPEDYTDLSNIALAAFVQETASGAIASFDDGADNVPVADLVVDINPVQSGSGDPSPTNVRPITGWTGANIGNVLAMPDMTEWDIEGVDEEISADDDSAHVLTLERKNIYTSIPFDPPQYLFAVTAAACAAFGWDPAVGMPAGQYNISVDHGAYNNGTTQDGVFQFATTQPIPVGGGIRHSILGAYRSDSDYSKARLLTGTFTTYGTDTVTVIESDLTTTEGNGGTNLGTATAETPTYHNGDYMNYTRRQAHGSNRWSTSYLRQVLNSDDATFVWERKTIFGRNLNATPEGFLHAIDPALRAVLTKVRKRYALHIVDNGGVSGGYEDIEDFVTLDTMMDVFGGQNQNVYEGPVDSNGAVKRTTQMSLWKSVTTNAGRIKRDSGNAARGWWLGSMYPSYCNDVRGVYTSGALGHLSAYNSYGVVPRLHIDLKKLLTISWAAEAGTVYGGTLDVTHGVLTVDKASVDLGNLNWSQSASGAIVYFRASIAGKATQIGGLTCSCYVQGASTVATSPDNSIAGRTNSTEVIIVDGSKAGMSASEFGVAVTGQTLVYPLATPITYQLTPQEVKTLLGVNNIWADTGDASVTYRADTKLYVDSKVAAVVAAMSES